MRKLSHLIGLVCFVLLLFPSCKKSPGDYVQLVKGGVLDFDKTLKVGDAYDNYKYFDQKEWKSFETDQKRIMVEFKGIVPVDLYKNEIEKEFGKKFQYFDKSVLNSIEYVTQFAISQKDDSFQIVYSGFNINLKNGEKNSIPDQSLDVIGKIYKNEMDALTFTIILSIEKDLENAARAKIAQEEENKAKLEQDENKKRFEALKPEALENAKKLWLENISYCGDSYFWRPQGKFDIVQAKGELNVSIDGIGEFPPQKEPSQADILNNVQPVNIEWKGIVSIHFEFIRYKKGNTWKEWTEGYQYSAYLIKQNGVWALDFSWEGSSSAPSKINCDEIKIE